MYEITPIKKPVQATDTPILQLLLSMPALPYIAAT
jgi:hypothetical protein